VRSSVALANERALSRLVGLAVPVLGDLGAIDLVQDRDAVIRTRRPALVDHDTEADLEAISQNAEQLALFRQLGQKSWIIAPLVVRERVLGAMTLAITEIQTALSSSGPSLATVVASQAAAVIDSARLRPRGRRGLVGGTGALEIIGRPYDLRQVVDAVRTALARSA